MSEDTSERPETAPSSFIISINAFDTEERATEFGQYVGDVVRAFSRIYDLSHLDGVTVSNNYREALANLDRGYDSPHQLTPSDSTIIGIAMTPSVLRGGILKSHIVINAGFLIPLENKEDANFDLALHTLAHECAHVEITRRFDMAFPGMLLRQQYQNLRLTHRWNTVLACWDEYAATCLSAPFGIDPTEGYEQNFIQYLGEAKQQTNRCIIAYRTHADVGRVVSEVYVAYGLLLKLACYHLGNLYGRDISYLNMRHTVNALNGHWFLPFFERIDTACREIKENYGRWQDTSRFDVIGDLIDEIVAEGGIFITDLDDGRIHADIPFTLETMPS